MWKKKCAAMERSHWIWLGEGRDELYYSLELRINQSRIIALMVG